VRPCRGRDCSGGAQTAEATGDDQFKQLPAAVDELHPVTLALVAFVVMGHAVKGISQHQADRAFAQAFANLAGHGFETVDAVQVVAKSGITLQLLEQGMELGQELGCSTTVHALSRVFRRQTCVPTG